MKTLIATRISDGKQFVVWKYLHGVDNDVWAWCRNLEGKLLVGRDCKLEFEEMKKREDSSVLNNFFFTKKSASALFPRRFPLPLPDVSFF